VNVPKADETATSRERTRDEVRGELDSERKALEAAVAGLRTDLKQVATVATSGTFAVGTMLFLARRLLGRRRRIGAS
jgi:hypothetical protein